MVVTIIATALALHNAERIINLGPVIILVTAVCVSSIHKVVT